MNATRNKKLYWTASVLMSFWLGLGNAAPALTPVVTDQTPLDLPSTFTPGLGNNITSDLNQAGDYLFSTRGQNGVFLRPAGAAGSTRLLQMGEEIPGYPGTRMDIIAGMRINNAGLIVFRVVFGSITGENQGAILAYDRAKFTTIAFSGDPAPGTGGARFGSNLNLTGLNDRGDVAFVAGVEVPGIFTNRSTLYLARFGSEPVRIVGLGDPAPESSGTLGPISGIALNDRGEVLFGAPIVGGGAFGFFVGSTAAVRKVVAIGDPNPLGGSFTSLSQAAVNLNGAGQTSFVGNGSLFLHDPDTGLAVAVGQGSPAPAPLGGTFGNIPLSPPHALNSAGVIAFFAPIVGSSVTNSGIFRFRPGGPVETVAYQNQVAPGTEKQPFVGFGRPSITESAEVSFRGVFGPSNHNGIFRQSGTDPAQPVVRDGDKAPVPGGGTFRLNSFSDPIKTLENSSIYFVADLDGGAAAFGEFLAAPAGIRPLLHSAEPLLEGSRVVLRTFKVGAAGDYLAFLAERTGGLISLMLHNLATGVTTKAISEGDELPGTGGARFRLYSPNKVHVNTRGTIAFAAYLVGGPGDGTLGLFLWNADAGVKKVVIDGDVESSTGSRFSFIIFNQITPSPLNSSGQVVFRANLVGRPLPTGIFVGSATAAPRAVVLGGDPSPDGSIFLTFLSQQSINEAGQVVFAGLVLGGRTGIYLSAPGAGPQKVVAEGDPAAEGSTFSTVSSIVSLNDNGEVGFMASLSGARSGGVFVGRAAAPPEPIALNGDLSPSGGMYAGLAANADVVINNRGDVAFKSDLTGGSPNSGYFLRRGDGTVQAVALEGQPAPETKGRFATLPSPIVGLLASNLVLLQSGDLIFLAPVIQDSTIRPGYWRFRLDDSLEKILVSGDPAPGSGGGTAGTPFFGANDGGSGPIVFDIGVVGGAVSDAIYVVSDPPRSR